MLFAVPVATLGEPTGSVGELTNPLTDQKKVSRR